MPITKESHRQLLFAAMRVQDQLITVLTNLGSALADSTQTRERLVERFAPLCTDPEALIFREAELFRRLDRHWHISWKEAERAKERAARKRRQGQLQPPSMPSEHYQNLAAATAEYDRTHPITYDKRHPDEINEDLFRTIRASDGLRPFDTSFLHRPFVSERPSEHFAKYVPMYCCSCQPDPIGYSREEMLDHLHKHQAEVQREFDTKHPIPVGSPELDLEDEDNLTEASVGFQPPGATAPSEES